MIIKEHIASYNRMKPYCREPMLMLGNQENRCGYDFGVKYTTLDPDEGDISWDLNIEIPPEWAGFYGTVYNLGTLEHVWDVHRAHVNAARMVKVGGNYLHHGPAAGYENHGIHITDWRMLLKFFKMNGFKILEYWFTLQDGAFCSPPVRNCRQNILLCFIAKKAVSVETFHCPQQIFKSGIKQAIF